MRSNFGKKRNCEFPRDSILVVDGTGIISKADGQFESMFGYETSEIQGQTIEVLMPERFRADHEGYLAKFRVNPHVRSMESMFDSEQLALHKDGSEFPVNIALSPVSTDSGTMIVAVIKDITESSKVNQELRKLAYYDQLTGLPNCISLLEDLENYLNQQDGHASLPISIAIVELDGLRDKAVTHDHSNGHQLIQEISRRLATAVGDRAQLYRTGSGEFTIVLQECGDPLRVSGVVNKMIGQLDGAINIGNSRLHIGANVGLVTSPSNKLDVQSLISNARLALSAAKKDPNNYQILYSPVLRSQAKAKRKLKQELRGAFANGEFELFFQPQVRLSDGFPTAAEALLRWQHPSQGMIGPNAFIDLLVNDPIAYDVGNWILKTACEKAAVWRASGLPPIRVSVNLFPAQLVGGMILKQVEDVLSDTALPASALELEITESIALSHEESKIEPLRVLRDRGVSIAFDDFSTANASIDYLAQYPLSRVKIDRSIIQEVPGNTEQAAIMHTLIMMAHSLDLEIVAKGVETSNQKAFLIANGCEEAQGFLFAKPLPEIEFIEFVKTAETIRLSLGQSPEKPGRQMQLTA